MNNFKITGLVALFFIFMYLGLGVVLADSPPSLPHTISGNVNVTGGPFGDDGSYDGTISARVNDENHGTTEIVDNEFSNLPVQNLDNGDEFTLYIGDYDTNETFIFESGKVEDIGLIEVQINDLIAEIDASETSIEEGDTITFDATGSEGSTGIVKYEWDFDTGGSDTGEIVEYTFSDAGSYDVQLTIADEANNEQSEYVTIDVEETVTGTTGTVPVEEEDEEEEIEDEDEPEPEEEEIDDEEEPEPEEEIDETSDIVVVDSYIENAQINETEELVVFVDLINNGTIEGNKTINLEVNDEILESQVASIGAGETSVLSFSQVLEPGEYNISINGADVGRLSVEALPDEEDPEPGLLGGLIVGEQPVFNMLGLLVLLVVILGLLYYRSYTVAGLSSRAQKLYEKADRLHEKGEYDKSISKVKKARNLQREADKRTY